MNTWKDVADRIKTLDLEFEAVESFNDVGKEYARMNNEQNFQGINQKGQAIVPAYTATTVAIKKRKGQPSDRVTLKDTGDFYQRRIAIADNTKIYIESDVPYADHLAEKYGDEIHGLTNDNRKDFTFGPYWSVLTKRIENITGLKFN